MKTFRIGLGVSGGIAAYKAVEVMRSLQKAGCEVSVAMTKHATEFVQPLTFRALTDKYVVVDDYDPQNPDPIAHINFSQEIDLLLIVPATANIIAKFANGIADDFLSSTYLAANAPVMIAPAMNVSMWENAATQRNIARLEKDGVYFVKPVAGELACKTVGTGKLEDVENIVSQAMSLMRNADRGVRNVTDGGNARSAQADIRPPAYAGGSDFSGEKILITVGGTREAIDPVRFISNHSSGKMGFAVAAAASERGADVTVVAGATTADEPAGVKIIRAITAEAMHTAVMAEWKNATVFIGAAAVADYAPVKAAATKIKKDAKDTMSLELAKTQDILADVSRSRGDGQIVVGFAAETTDVNEYARSKMEKKGLDMVVANDITAKGAGFNTDTNSATIIIRGEKDIELPLMPKREMADKILDEIAKIRIRSRSKQ